MFGRKTKRIKELEMYVKELEKSNNILNYKLDCYHEENSRLKAKLPRRDQKTGKFIKR